MNSRTGYYYFFLLVKETGKGEYERTGLIEFCFRKRREEKIHRLTDDLL